MGIRQFAANATLARRLPAAPPSAPAWLVPGRGVLCLLFPTRPPTARQAPAGVSWSMNCVPTKGVQQRGLVDTTVTGGSVQRPEVLIQGVVADGVPSVVVVSEEGAQRLAVTANGFSTTATAPKGIRISGPRGAGGRVDFGQLPPPAQ
jgi:hypothetical protein